MRPGLVYDSNATILADAVRELGGEPVPLGIVARRRAALRRGAAARRWRCDLVLLSGGTSKGAATSPTASSPSWARRASSRTASR